MLLTAHAPFRPFAGTTRIGAGGGKLSFVSPPLVGRGVPVTVINTVRQATNLGLSYFSLGQHSTVIRTIPTSKVVSKLNWVQPASIGNSSKSRN
jgi:hypothetical protein